MNEDKNNKYIVWSESPGGKLYGPIVVFAPDGKTAAMAAALKLDLLDNALIELAGVGANSREWYRLEISLKVREA